MNLSKLMLSRRRPTQSPWYDFPCTGLKTGYANHWLELGIVVAFGEIVARSKLKNFQGAGYILFIDLGIGYNESIQFGEKY